MSNLPTRYPNPQAATAAGWIRYSREDRTGAISFVNTKYWDTTDPDLPAQLWYDVNGRLLGADFSVPQAESVNGPPNRFGIASSRWFKIPAHVHYVQRNADGSIAYGKAMRADRYATANNGDYSHPTAAGMVAAGAVTDASAIPFVFLYPAIYDVTVWVVPNPLGQFADAEPGGHAEPARRPRGRRRRRDATRRRDDRARVRARLRRRSPRKPRLRRRRRFRTSAARTRAGCARRCATASRR